MAPRQYNVQCNYCTRTFYRDSARDQHQRDVHPQGGRVVPRIPLAANHDTPAKAAATIVYTNANPKEDFIVDFVTLAENNQCICGAKGIIPLTSRCPACDPLLSAMTAIAQDAADKEAERKAKPTGIISNIAAFMNGGRGPHQTELTYPFEGGACYDH